MPRLFQFCRPRHAVSFAGFSTAQGWVLTPRCCGLSVMRPPRTRAHNTRLTASRTRPPTPHRTGGGERYYFAVAAQHAAYSFGDAASDTTSHRRRRRCFCAPVAAIAHSSQHRDRGLRHADAPVAAKGALRPQSPHSTQFTASGRGFQHCIAPKPVKPALREALRAKRTRITLVKKTAVPH